MIRNPRPKMISAPHSGQQPATFSLQEAKELFIAQLKAKYEQHFNAVQPLPYKNKFYRVDEIFLDVVINILAESWIPLGSCRKGLSSVLKKFKRLIVLGDPGYGSSMLTIQCAFDWCKGTYESYFKDVELLILLRLSQVGNISSIYKAIRKSILHNDTRLTESDIQNVVESSSSVVFIFDGLDGFSELENHKSDIMKIILAEMCQRFQVIITSRYLPKNKAPATAILRLSGLNDVTQEEYIRNVVVGKDVGAAKRLRENLRGSHLLEDLCQVPFIFVMLARLSHEKNNFRSCKTLTNVFEEIMKCFYTLAKHKGTGTITKKKEFWKFEDYHRKLDEMAFKALSGRNQQVRWRKEILREKLGREIYDQYVQMGVLIEEEVGYQTHVKFFHKIFCEWYAAHFLAADRYELKEELDYMHPCDIQYFYRFVCGLNPSIAGSIIKWVNTFEGGDSVAIMCISELQGKVSGLLDGVEDLCEKEIKIDVQQSKFLQRSILHLLSIASTAKISIPSLELKNCFRSVDIFSGNFHIQAGMNIPSLSLTTVKQLWIEEEGRELSETEVAAIFKYAEMWLSLKSLWFRFCLLPWTFKSKSASVLQSRSIEVFWIPDFAGRVYTLRGEGSRCVWKHGGGTMMNDEYQEAMEKIHQHRTQRLTFDYIGN